jgi:hypothetical protein
MAIMSNQEEEFLNNDPQPSRITESLRDTGYDFNVAIADIVDNSIDAGAKNVDITFAFDLENNVVISLVDDGSGMNKDGLADALRYGAADKPDTTRLGKFGLGLKTASTSFCRRIELTSRFEPSGEVTTAVFDLDTVAERNEWVTARRFASAEEIADLDRIAKSGTGTVVRWRKIDRILENYKVRDGEPRKKALGNLQKDLTLWLGTVFQRFIDDTFEDVPNVAISINGVPIKPWDPFCVDIVEPLYDKELELEDSEGNSLGFLGIKCYVLPRKEDFPSPERQAEARILNKTQGVYIYRENRLIHGPDWLGLYSMEPHFNLARVRLDFTESLDLALKVDIKKSRIVLDPSLSEELKSQFFFHTRNLAEERRRSAERDRKKTNPHTAASNTISSKIGTLVIPKIGEVAADSSAAVVDSNIGEPKRVSLRIVVAEQPGEVHIETANDLRDGVLWVPSVIGGNNGVTLNASHDFYQKAYLPHIGNSNIIQALDFLIWAVAQAELNNIDANSDAFEDFRIEVSKNLRKLVANLPDASLPESPE